MLCAKRLKLPKLPAMGIYCAYLLAAGLVAQEQSAPDVEPKIQLEATQEAESREQNIRQTISFGVDTDLVTVLQTLMRETPQLPTADDKSVLWLQQTPYNEAIYERIQKGYSSTELQMEAVRFFMRQKWLGAHEYIENILERGVTAGRSDDNLLLAALSYVRNLKVKSSEQKVLSLLVGENPSANPRVAEQSIITLGQIGSESSAAQILKLLENEENNFANFIGDREQNILRVAAIAAMGDLAYLGASDYLLKILRGTDEPEYSSEYSNSEWGAAAKALGALGQLQQLQAVPLVLAKFRTGNSRERYRAIAALSAFSPREEFANIVLQGLQESYWKTREEAAKAAGELQLQVAIPSLAYKVAKDNVAGVRRAAIGALRQMGGQKALSAVVSNSEVGETQRLDILRNLIGARDESVVEFFQQFLNNEEHESGLSRALVFGVAGAKPWSALAFVYKEMLAHSEAKIQRSALQAISRERIKSLQKEVTQLAEETSNPVLRQAAKSTLANLNS